MYFIDIETVPISQKLVGNPLRDLFQKKFESTIYEMVVRDPPLPYEVQEALVEDLWREKAGLHAEFGKIVCVAVGRILNTPEGSEIQVKKFASRFEDLILKQVSKIIGRFNEKGEPIVVPLCAHNGFDFDFPWLFRRYQINGLPIPKVINVNSLKKWKWPLHDTMQMWSHTQWNYKCSLDLLCTTLGIQSPKNSMSGDSVADIYYGMFDWIDNESLPFDKETEALEKIGAYCAADVIALAKVYCKLTGVEVPTKASIVE